MDWLRRFLSPESRRLRLSPELRREIRASFDRAASDEEHFPTTIDPRIYHVKLILDYLGDLAGRSVLDVGCGKGRFARIVKERYPLAAVWAMDISTAMLTFVPPGIHRCAASMTELPFRTDSFDGAYATESLEHAVDIETAVAEICRVVKPGGTIAVIDKNAQQWGRLETSNWERWFGRRELERQFRRHCSEVTSRHISYWEDVKPDGLFIAWLARK